MRLTLGVLAALACLLGVAAQVRPPASAAAGRIGGRVVTAYGELVADADVTLARLGQSQRTVRSDERGHFNFAGVAPGRYSLSAAKPGYTGRGSSSRVDAGQATAVSSGRFERGVDLEISTDGQALTLELSLQRAASISGRIIRPDGSPAPDVEVFAARSLGSGPVALLDTRTVSEWDGRYTIPDLPPGEFLVAVRHRPGAGVAGPLQWTFYPGVPDTEPGRTVTLLDGVPAQGIDIWLTPAQRFNVSGRVFWPAGVAAENIVIDYGDPAGSRSGVWFLSDPGGLFTLTGIPPGPLVMLARADTDQGSLFGIASTDVVVESVEDVQIVVDRPGIVEGRVSDRGNAVPSARTLTIVLTQKLFAVSAIYPAPEAVVEEDGRFRLGSALGEYEFEIRGLPVGQRVTRVLRDGVPLRGNRISVRGGEVVRGLEVVVGP